MNGLQRIDARTERRTQVGEIAHQPQYGPWLNTADAATYLRYTGKHPRLSVYKFLKRHGIVPRHDGRRVLIARADIERALSVSHTGGQLRAVPLTPSIPSSVIRERGIR